ncbi:uroporphyrinogen-III synthase [Chrysiogenes arsenatis]|uniref:uroporphyrinogen-III synthase n=1 Tax=Chrysiogenes arsenatis TaxID=309797 RepID=UPI00048094A4|nr:uroporphyrinogen-III synthase [Chrysiogenes arsenatis]
MSPMTLAIDLGWCDGVLPAAVAHHFPHNIAFHDWGSYLVFKTLHATFNDVEWRADGAITLTLANAESYLGDQAWPLVVNTRPVSQSWSFTQRLLQHHYRVAVLPATETLGCISPTTLSALAWESYQGVLFTSREGVRYLAQAFPANTPKPSAFAIGESTAAACRNAGFPVAYTGQTAEAEAFASDIIRDFPARGRLLLAQAAKGRPVLQTLLTEAGFVVDTITTHDSHTIIHPIKFLRAILDSHPCCMVFTSSYAATSLLGQLRHFPTDHLPPLVTIGPPTSHSVAVCGYTVTAQASPYNVDGLLSVIPSCGGRP